MGQSAVEAIGSYNIMIRYHFNPRRPKWTAA